MFIFDVVNKAQPHRKHPINHLEAQLANKFYIHRGGIYQIVRLKNVGFTGIEVYFQKPNGKYSLKTITGHGLNKRGVFNTFEEASEHLLNTWVTENKLPKRRKEYIDELREYFQENGKEFYGICSFS